MADTPAPGNPFGGPPPRREGPPPAPGKPADPPPADAPPAPDPSGYTGRPADEPARLADAIARVASTVDGMTVEIEQLRRRQRSMERQTLMILGVLAVILWRQGASYARKVSDGFNEGVSDAVSG